MMGSLRKQVHVCFFALVPVKFKTYLGIFNEWFHWAVKGQRVQYTLDICFMAYNFNTAVLEESLAAELQTPSGNCQKDTSVMRMKNSNQTVSKRTH